MIQYLVWRILTDLQPNITLSFLVVGHTKFASNGWFGIFKCLYRRTKVGTCGLKDREPVANMSGECNFAQLASQEDIVWICKNSDKTIYTQLRLRGTWVTVSFVNKCLLFLLLLQSGTMVNHQNKTGHWSLPLDVCQRKEPVFSHNSGRIQRARMI